MRFSWIFWPIFGISLAVFLTACAQSPIGFTLVPWNARIETSPSSGMTTCEASNGFTANILKAGNVPGFFYPASAHGLYPGSFVYATIDGQRFFGEERITIDPRFRNALLSGTVMSYSYSPWPKGVRIEQRISLSGIERALPCLGN